MNNFPQWLKQIRKQKNITQRDAARTLEIAQGRLSQLETGATVPRFYDVLALSAFYGADYPKLPESPC